MVLEADPQAAPQVEELVMATPSIPLDVLANLIMDVIEKKYEASTALGAAGRYDMAWKLEVEAAGISTELVSAIQNKLLKMGDTELFAFNRVYNERRSWS